MIPPFSPVIYNNRTSFTTLTVMEPLLDTLVHNITALSWDLGVYGWFQTMDIRLDGLTQLQAFFWLDEAIGRMAKLKAYGETLWEGMVYEVSIQLPGATLTRSMEDMANSVYVEYSDNDTGAQEVTSASADTASQTLYGVKEVYVPGGTMTSTRATAHADRYKHDHKDPPLVREITDRPLGTSTVRIHCEGYWHTLVWQYYTSTTSGTQDSATTVGDILTSEAAFLSATQNLDATGLTLEQRFPQRATAWDQILSLVAQGTSNDLRYFFGVKEGRIATGWEEPITVQYVKFASKPNEWFDATGGFPLRYWQVEPGYWVRSLIASRDYGAPSRAHPDDFIIGSCSYDAVARRVRPSYEVKLPTFAKPSARQKTVEENPWEKPWTNYEFNVQGYRTFYYQGKWHTQYTQAYKRAHLIAPYGPHLQGPE